jgi:hypothetical protein
MELFAAPADARTVAGERVSGARTHFTITTEKAGAEHALETFDREWYPLIEDALAFWRDRLPLR